ncbi:MAG: TonB-dependent receptor, partial [Muribaculaceae bacterium]|nr:TonB-dependent receptor [Muribaculaceae bacterium]
FYRTHYVNNDDKQVKIDNLYRQREIYLSSANMLSVNDRINLSASYDFLWNDLQADVYGFARPTRFTNLLSMAGSFNIARFKLQASCLFTHIHDRLRGQQAPDDKAVFTPAAYMSVQPLSEVEPLTVRAFYKRSFRMPTFNDLYYADMGNSKLNPEHVTQYNVGLLWDCRSVGGGFVTGTRLGIDTYYNKVRDKIVAYPKGQQFRWTMLNLGIVDIKGVDVNGSITVNPVDRLNVTFRAQYTWQRAIDVTDPADNYYRDQIPYIPHHSGSAVINADWRGWTLNYSFIYVGERYNQQENIRYNYTQPWYTSDVSATRELRVGRVDMRVMVEVNNLLSQDYDVIINYPMPKRNYRFSLMVNI